MHSQTAPVPASIQHLNAVVTALVTAHPAAAVRIARGADLVEQGHVEPTYNGIYLVQSESQPDKAYAVIRVGDRWTCCCPDATQRGNLCKHGHAVVIYLACERLDAEQTDLTPTLDLFEQAIDVYGEPYEYRYVPTAQGIAYLDGVA